MMVGLVARAYGSPVRGAFAEIVAFLSKPFVDLLTAQRSVSVLCLSLFDTVSRIDKSAHFHALAFRTAIDGQANEEVEIGSIGFGGCEEVTDLNGVMIVEWDVGAIRITDL
jgi:hypothetical protein